VFGHNFVNFGQKIKFKSVLETGESCGSIYCSGETATIDLLGFRRSYVETPSAEAIFHRLRDFLLLFFRAKIQI
jgi:hypothetical protein